MMKQCLVLAQNSAFAASVSGWLTQACAVEARRVAPVVVGDAPGPATIPSAFERLAETIETYLNSEGAGAGSPELVVITDLCGYGLVSPADLNPLGHNGWASVLGMLVLACPEVQWVFASGTPSRAWCASPELGGGRLGYAASWSRLHFANDPSAMRSLLEHARPGIASMFDGLGLRDALRGSVGSDVRWGVALPRRSNLAVAVDDERSYAFLHAYVAYRFGYRAAPLYTAKLADLFLGADHGYALIPNLGLTFEDIYVHFPDGGAGMSRLYRERRERWPRLEDSCVRRRVFVTSGQQNAADQEKWAQNEVYFNQRRAAGCSILIRPKPYAGIFRLGQDSGLAPNGDGANHTQQCAMTPGFAATEADGELTESEHGHSSPGALLLIAERLIERARSLEAAVGSLQGAIRGAVLANEAFEMLGNRTPTLAFEALRLKHAFEALAECQFSGVEHHIQLKDRLKEVRRDVERVSKRFAKNQQKTAADSAELRILLSLVTVFQEYGHFNDDQLCLVKIRRLNRTLWMRQKWPRRLLFPLLWYLEWLLSSFAVFLIVLVGWVVGLTLLYAWAAGHPIYPCGLSEAVSHGISDAVSSFFSVGAPLHPEPSQQVVGSPDPTKDGPFVAVACLSIVSGFFHLGVFISHLYTIVARK